MDRFISKLNEAEEETDKASPVLVDEGICFIFVPYSNLYLLAMTRENVNAAAVLVFLHKLKDIFKQYFTEVNVGGASPSDQFLLYFTIHHLSTPTHLPMRSWRRNRCGITF